MAPAKWLTVKRSVPKRGLPKFFDASSAGRSRCDE